MNTPKIALQIVRALLNKAKGSESKEEALAIYDDIVNRFGSSSTTEVRKHVITALSNKLFLLIRIGRDDEVVGVCDEIIYRIGTPEDPGSLLLCAVVLDSKASALANVGNSSSAIEIYDQALEYLDVFGNRWGKQADFLVAGIITRKGVAFVQSNQEKEAIATFDDVVTRFRANDDPILAYSVASAILCKGIVLAGTDQTVSGSEIKWLLAHLPSIGDLLEGCVSLLIQFSIVAGPAPCRRADSGVVVRRPVGAPGYGVGTYAWSVAPGRPGS